MSNGNNEDVGEWKLFGNDDRNAADLQKIKHLQVRN